MGLEYVASASIAFAAGTPGFVAETVGGSATFFNDGFDATITDNGAGDVSVTLVATRAIDQSECMFFANVVGALAASQLTDFGIAHTSDTVKRLTILREGAAGAVSALTDVDFAFAMYRRVY